MAKPKSAPLAPSAAQVGVAVKPSAEQQNPAGQPTEQPVETSLPEQPGETEAPADATGQPPRQVVKARVLVDCAYGACNDVIEVDPVQAQALGDVLDPTPEAVAYALSLTVAQ